MCVTLAVSIMRIYCGTADNECNMHALVGGIIHQVGQVWLRLRTAIPPSRVHLSQPLGAQTGQRGTFQFHHNRHHFLPFASPTPKKDIPAHYEEPPVMMVKCMRQHGELKAEEVLSESDASVDQQDFGEMSDCSISDVLYSKCSAVDHIGTFMKNVQVLLDAANYIENVERNSGSKWGKRHGQLGGDIYFFNT